MRDDRVTLFRTPSLPRVPHLHGLVAHVPLSADEAEALAQEHLGESPARRVLPVDDGPVGELVARGWVHEPVLVLGRRGALEPPSAPALAEEVPYGHVRGLRDEWIRGAPWAKGDEEVQRAITYFANQSGAGRMDYPSRVQANEPIGSGVTEAACKVLVKQRLCGSGMRWKDAGAAAVLSVRCLTYTTGRWSQFWARIDQYGFPVAA